MPVLNSQASGLCVVGLKHSATVAVNIVVCIPPPDELEDEPELLEEDELELEEEEEADELELLEEEEDELELLEEEEDELELLDDVEFPELDVLLELVEPLDDDSSYPPVPPAPDDGESSSRGS